MTNMHGNHEKKPDAGGHSSVLSASAPGFPEAQGTYEGDGESAAYGRAPESTLIIDVEGYEGPMDVLLALARTQKVDLTRISVLALAEQYLVFVAEASRLELDLAADYLVMASWLAYLKSRLLLPPSDSDDGEPTGEELAARLAFQLQRLEAMRKASRQLMARQRMGIDFFSRGKPEGILVTRTSEWQGGTLYDLLKAYSVQRLKGHNTRYKIERIPVLSLEEARKRLEKLLHVVMDWNRIEHFFPPAFRQGKKSRSAMASTLSATLEMAKDGQLEIRQTAAFETVYVRSRKESMSVESAK